MARRHCRPRYTESPAQTTYHITQKALPPADLPPPTHRGVLPHRETPTIEDLYKWLEGLEAQAEQSTRLLMEVMAQLVHNNELEEEREELEEECEEETRMEIQKVGQTVEKWTYLSITAILVWKIVGAAWKQHAPAVQEQTAIQEQTAVPRSKRDPFYIE